MCSNVDSYNASSPQPIPFLPPQLVELKSGETYNGHMVLCDSWMNIHLREVICTSKVIFVYLYRTKQGLAVGRFLEAS